MREKRVYIITLMQLVQDAGPLGDYYVPWLGGFTHWDDGDNPDYWECTTSHDHIDGVFDSAIVGIYTTPEIHQQLENDPHIARIDDL